MRNSKIGKIKYKSVLVLCIIVIIIVIRSSLLLKNNNKDLVGDKIINSLYSYNIKDNAQSINIIDNNLYYLTNKDDEYQLYKLDIYTKKSKEIITSEDAAVKDLVGQFFQNSNYYNIILARGTLLYEKSFCHEMMHAIDHNALEKNYEISDKWYDYNPKYFEYGVKNYQDGNLIYTTYAYDEKDIYFIDPYSKLNQDEDRARIFENIYYVNEENIIKKYPNLMKKAVYLRDELLKFYSSLNNSKVFDSMN